MRNGALNLGGPLDPDEPAYTQRKDSLAEALLALDCRRTPTHEREARRLADVTFDHSRAMVDRYALIRPPGLHNLLVHMGFKERGLCHHWAADLAQALRALEPDRFVVTRALAHRTSALRCHAGVVVTARGQPFSEGVLLDAWRGSGDVYFGPVRDDDYPWEPR
jgi:hypothetical protein